LLDSLLQEKDDNGREIMVSSSVRRRCIPI